VSNKEGILLALCLESGAIRFAPNYVLEHPFKVFDDFYLPILTWVFFILIALVAISHV
jgi:hypothetical protein